MTRTAFASAILAVSVFAYTAAAQQPILIALRTTTERPPAPVNDLVTLNLASGAEIKIRPRDVDYPRTAAYRNRVVLAAWTATERIEKTSGRKYLDMSFSNRFVATAWLDDVDGEEARKGFPIYLAYVASDQARRAADNASSSAVGARIHDKCAADWPDNYVMQEACEKSQLAAYKRLNGGGR